MTRCAPCAFWLGRGCGEKGPARLPFWFIALGDRYLAGFLPRLFFRKGINALQALLYGTEDVPAFGTAILGSLRMVLGRF